MTNYRNLSGKSGVVAYEIGENHIVVEFSSGRQTHYKYIKNSVGSVHLEKLKELARAGHGLNSYIMLNEEVKNSYESKW